FHLAPAGGVFVFLLFDRPNTDFHRKRIDGVVAPNAESLTFEFAVVAFGEEFLPLLRRQRGLDLRHRLTPQTRVRPPSGRPRGPGALPPPPASVCAAAGPRRVRLQDQFIHWP